MNTLSLPGRLIAATGSAFLVVSTLSAAADPWAKALPAPTACYDAQDQFASKNEVAIESLSAEISRQAEINRKLDDQRNAQMDDPMKMAARVQELMMKDPQNAQKYMQAMGATDPAATQAALMEHLEKGQQMEAEEKALLKRYSDALAAAYAPSRAKFAALGEKVSGQGELISHASLPAWAIAESSAIKREADMAYAALCARWFTASGPMHAYAKRYKDYLVNERIPFDENAHAQKVASFALSGIATESYRSTALQDGVRDYMKVTGRLFGAREAEARCTATKCNDAGAI